MKMGSFTEQIFVANVTAARRDIIRSGWDVSDTEVIAVLLNGIPYRNISGDFHSLFRTIKQKMAEAEVLNKRWRGVETY